MYGSIIGLCESHEAQVIITISISFLWTEFLRISIDIDITLYIVPPNAHEICITLVCHMRYCVFAFCAASLEYRFSIVETFQ